MTHPDPVKEARTTAKTTQAMASPMAPAEIATLPIGESAKPLDRTIQTNMGNAVTERAAPKNRTCWTQVAPPVNHPGTPDVHSASGTAKQKGTTTPAKATATVNRPRFRT